jgi:hypothetical protein
MPVARPPFFDWNNYGPDPDPAQRAAGFSVSQLAPAQAKNFLIGTWDNWTKYAADYIDNNYASDLAAGNLMAPFATSYPMRQQWSATIVPTCLAARTTSNVVDRIYAGGNGGLLQQFLPATSAAPATYSWGVGSVDILDMVRGSDRFVACSTLGNVRWSLDGAVSTWTQAFAALGGTSTLTTIAYSSTLNRYCVGGLDAGGVNGTTLIGDAAGGAWTTRALPGNLVPRKIVWAGAPFSRFYAVTTTGVYQSTDPTTVAWTLVNTIALQAVTDARWHPDLGVFVAGYTASPFNLRVYVLSTVAGTFGGGTSIYDNTYAGVPNLAQLVPLPGATGVSAQMMLIVTYGSGFSASTYWVSNAGVSAPDPAVGRPRRYVMPAANIRAAKIIGNAIYAVGQTSATVGALYASAPREANRPYAQP